LKPEIKTIGLRQGHGPEHPEHPEPKPRLGDVWDLDFVTPVMTRFQQFHLSFKSAIDEVCGLSLLLTNINYKLQGLLYPYPLLFKLTLSSLKIYTVNSHVASVF
jgi:hypothetical protein